jgi:hypothetical protein
MNRGIHRFGRLGGATRVEPVAAALGRQPTRDNGVLRPVESGVVRRNIDSSNI